jgi:hypothetical protein
MTKYKIKVTSVREEKGFVRKIRWLPEWTSHIQQKYLNQCDQNFFMFAPFLEKEAKTVAKPRFPNISIN